MKTRVLCLLLLITTALTASAKFVQEMELKDGTILVGYVYRQQPSRFMVFHVDRARKDPNSRYMQHDKNYTLQWKDVKYIRRSEDSQEPWCHDKVTLKNGSIYIGQIEEQEVGVSMSIRLQDTGKITKINNSDLLSTEKIVDYTGKDIWLDRQYTNRLKLNDNSIHEGIIVLQYRGQKTTDSYIELQHASGYRERIFQPDIKEYIMQLQ